MCDVCEKNPKTYEERMLTLDEIAKRIKAGEDPEHFDTLIGSLLDMEEEQASDPELDAIWLEENS